MKTLAIIGIIGGLLCATADLLLDLKGTDNKKLGKMGIIDSAWSRMPLWCVILNPLIIQIIGLLLRATKLKVFIDAPSCCAASLGLAMYGVLALICM